jgi:hypothetical protein
MADQAKKTVGQYVNWISKYVEACLEDINNMRQLQAQEQTAGGCLGTGLWTRLGWECWDCILKCAVQTTTGPKCGRRLCSTAKMPCRAPHKACVLTYCCCLPCISAQQLR